MKKIIFVLLMAGLIADGCKKDNPPAAAEATFLKTSWVLSYIQDVNTNLITWFPDDAARKITIVFTDSLNVITFSGICNWGSGTYSYSPADNTLAVTDLGSTKIACVYVEWEGYVIQNLNHAVSLLLNGSDLTVYSTGNYNLHFKSL